MVALPLLLVPAVVSIVVHAISHARGTVRPAHADRVGSGGVHGNLPVAADGVDEPDSIVPVLALDGLGRTLLAQDEDEGFLPRLALRRGLGEGEYPVGEGSVAPPYEGEVVLAQAPDGDELGLPRGLNDHVVGGAERVAELVVGSEAEVAAVNVVGQPRGVRVRGGMVLGPGRLGGFARAVRRTVAVAIVADLEALDPLRPAGLRLFVATEFRHGRGPNRFLGRRASSLSSLFLG